MVGRGILRLSLLGGGSCGCYVLHTLINCLPGSKEDSGIPLGLSPLHEGLRHDCVPINVWVSDIAVLLSTWGLRHGCAPAYMGISDVAVFLSAVHIHSVLRPSSEFERSLIVVVCGVV